MYLEPETVSPVIPGYTAIKQKNLKKSAGGNVNRSRNVRELRRRKQKRRC
jgi:hypothetical protein